jgi:hypothetical protein
MKHQEKRQKMFSLPEKNQFQANPFETIECFISMLVAESPLNRLSQIDNSPIFERPLIGIADGNDLLFEEYKSIIGEFHLTPLEILNSVVSPFSEKETYNDISVVCWALPFTQRIKKSNGGARQWPSLRWSHGTHFGEKFNNRVRQSLVNILTSYGYKAVAPMLSPQWTRITHFPGGHTSNWSERHALYAAGMGSFSLNDGFITEYGIAMRCGSVVVNTKLPLIPRKYNSHVENCLFYPDKKCGVCFDRCPANAISIKGHDKVSCRKYREEFFGNFLSKQCGVHITSGSCGLCQTDVPCESKIPKNDDI